MMPNKQHILTKYRVLIPFVLLSLLSACATMPTEPNPVPGGPYPGPFSAIFQKNPTVAKELLRIPELQDGISPAEVNAIQEISALYERNDIAFNRAFREMMSIGLPNIRRFCAPMQAIFWLALDGKTTELAILIDDFSLPRLLDQAWTFSQENDFTMVEVKRIIEGIQDERKREEHRQNAKNFVLARVQGMLIHEYKMRPEIFSLEAAEIIKPAIHPREDPRWKSFQEVTERLNAPELINYYEQKRFQFRYYWSIPFYSAQSPNPYVTFINNGGDCVYITAFSVYCLQKAGYKAWEKRMPHRSALFPYHAVAAFEWKNKIYLIDNADDKRGLFTLEDY